jgi:hypothetical protein
VSVRERRGRQPRRSSGGGSGRRSNAPYLLFGGLATLAIALGGVILFLPGPGGLATATPTPTSGPSSIANASASAGATAPGGGTKATGQPSQPAQTPDGTAGESASPGGSPAPSTKPTVTALTIQRSADCTKDYGYGSPGFIRISWTSTGTTGVRISIDPPDVKTAYGYGYKDEPSSGSDWVPFACDATFHQYVVTTLHTTGYYSYRYAKVSSIAPASS